MSDAHHLKDHNREARIFSHRLFVAAVLMVGLLSILVARYYNLQIVNHKTYVTESEKNRVHVQSILPTRGLIYDRKGRLLADNRPSYTLSLILERVKDLPATLIELSKLVTITPYDFERFERVRRDRRHRRPYEAVPLRYRLNEQDIARLAVNEYRLEGVEVEAQLIRYYPHGILTAHSVGYLGSMNQREKDAMTAEQLRLYGNGERSIGKTGVEKSYEQILVGKSGFQNVETNARGRVLRVLEREDPTPGKALKLYLDADLQKTAQVALGDHRGAVVAIEVETGGVLAMISTPSFDANLFVIGISHKDYDPLNTSEDKPLFNRSIQGKYPPASTVKPMLALAGLHYGVTDETRTIIDPGFYQLAPDERKYRDWKRGGHGRKVNMLQAIAESCDTYFYDLAVRMGIDRMSEFGRHFGLGARTGIDVPNESSGNWPSKAWKKSRHGLPWFPGDSLNVSIGQGFTQTTPLQLAEMTATIAARGVRKKPMLVRAVGEQEIPPQVVDRLQVSERHWDIIFNAMREVVHGRRGTGQRIRRGAGYEMAGKTGTAQVIGIKQDEEYDASKIQRRHLDHALFIGFAPYKNPKIAVAIVVENGEHGSSTAAPIARKIFDAYLLDKGEHIGDSGIRSVNFEAPAQAQAQIQTLALKLAGSEL